MGNEILELLIVSLFLPSFIFLAYKLSERLLRAVDFSLSKNVFLLSLMNFFADFTAFKDDVALLAPPSLIVTSKSTLKNLFLGGMMVGANGSAALFLDGDDEVVSAATDDVDSVVVGASDGVVSSDDDSVVVGG